MFPGELTRGPNKLACEPAAIATPSVRNDAAFLATWVGVTSVLATTAGVVLPGDWGFFSSYLILGSNLVILAIGSTAPGLLTVITDKFSLVFPVSAFPPKKQKVLNFGLTTFFSCSI